MKPNRWSELARASAGTQGEIQRDLVGAIPRGRSRGGSGGGDGGRDPEGETTSAWRHGTQAHRNDAKLERECQWPESVAWLHPHHCLGKGDT